MPLKQKPRVVAAEASRPEASSPESQARGSEAPETAAAAASAQPVVSPERLAGAVEAILLSLDKPVAAARLAEALCLQPGGPKSSPARQIESAVEELNRQYEATGRSFRIERVAGGLRVMTLPEHAEALSAFHASRAGAKLSRAAVETLAIIAYRQPVTRAQLEAIRGVACGDVLRTLLDRRLIEISGRAEEVGRPLLYGTGKRFLETFGLASLKDLPAVGEVGGLKA